MRSLLPETIAYGFVLAAALVLCAVIARDFALAGRRAPPLGYVLAGLVACATVSAAGVFTASLLRLIDMGLLLPVPAAAIRAGIELGVFGGLAIAYWWRFLLKNGNGNGNGQGR